MPLMCPCIPSSKTAKSVAATRGAARFYLVDCEALRDGRKGIVYRNSKNLDDRDRGDQARTARWGDIVDGTCEDDAWVRIQDKYLPITLHGYTLLHRGYSYKLEAEERLKSSCPAGVFLRGSKDLSDKTTVLEQWGETVLGFPAGEGWLRVGNNYLPSTLDGEQYLQSLEQDPAAAAEALAIVRAPASGSAAVGAAAPPASGSGPDAAQRSIGSKGSVGSVGAAAVAPATGGADTSAGVAPDGEGAGLGLPHEDAAERLDLSWADAFQGRWANVDGEEMQISRDVVEWPDDTRTTIVNGNQEDHARAAFKMTFYNEDLHATLDLDGRLHWNDGDVWQRPHHLQTVA